MYKKVFGFCNNTKNIFWHNKCVLGITYNASKSATKLDHVNLLLSNLDTGEMLGWVENNEAIINETIKIKKYCISSWIDESSGSIRKIYS